MLLLQKKEIGYGFLVLLVGCAGTETMSVGCVRGGRYGAWLSAAPDCSRISLPSAQYSLAFSTPLLSSLTPLSETDTTHTSYIKECDRGSRFSSLLSIAFSTLSTIVALATLGGFRPAQCLIRTSTTSDWRRRTSSNTAPGAIILFIFMIVLKMEDTRF